MPAASFQALKAQRQAKLHTGVSPSSSSSTTIPTSAVTESARGDASEDRSLESATKAPVVPSAASQAAPATIKSEPIPCDEAQAAAAQEAKQVARPAADNTASSSSPGAQQSRVSDPKQEQAPERFEPNFLPEDENPSIQVRKTPERGRGLFWHPKDGNTVCKKGEMTT